MLHMAGASREALDIGFWRSVYGFSMEPVADQIAVESQGKAVIADVPASSLLTHAVPIKSFDLTSMRPEEADFSADFTLPFTAQVDCQGSKLKFTRKSPFAITRACLNFQGDADRYKDFFGGLFMCWQEFRSHVER